MKSALTRLDALETQLRSRLDGKDFPALTWSNNHIKRMANETASIRASLAALPTVGAGVVAPTITMAMWEAGSQAWVDWIHRQYANGERPTDEDREHGKHEAIAAMIAAAPASPVRCEAKPSPSDCSHYFPTLGDGRVCVSCGWDFKNGEPPAAAVDGGPEIQRWAMARGSDGARWSVYMDHCAQGEWVKWTHVQQAWLARALTTPSPQPDAGGVVAWLDLIETQFGRHYETSTLAKDMPKGRYYFGTRQAVSVDDAMVERAASAWVKAWNDKNGPSYENMMLDEKVKIAGHVRAALESALSSGEEA